ncbi:hypothetical protein DVR12_12980 [Chitinophaga silvatica]|uniref:Uncharacterized protein n=1 Tax=Chitinophaga silvatica TaxID=2282649 RepID=A0A3E1YB46_9BACT|nr:hypothetical protein [Chitinophaga silvatica]RFS22701.1 hypothetical protein DVR12_12980 [Chitinophaga silvatica]
MNSILYFVIAILIIVFYLWPIKRKQSKNDQPSITIQSNKEATEFINRLAELGYFKYADPKDVDSLKKNMIEEYDPAGEFPMIWDDVLPRAKDYRYYFCDNEDLFEHGGFISMLNDLKPIFAKIGLTIEVNDHYECYNQISLSSDQTITINRVKYTVFKGFKGYGWNEAVQRFVEIINDQLAQQNKEDRLYPVGGGNDGKIILLSDEQFKYIDSVYTNPKVKPLQVKDWCNAMDVKYMEVK